VAGKTLAAAKDRLTEALGREASGSEVYLAHFLGERGAIRMLQAGDDAVAAGVDPRAAGANQPLFYENGRPVSVAELKDKLAIKLGMAPAGGEPALYRGPMAPEAPVGPVPARRSLADAEVMALRPSVTPETLGARESRIAPQIFASILDMQADFIRGEAREATANVLTGKRGG
jgi:hypothetical protein